MKHSEQKSNQAFNDLIAREDYLVTQANILAKAFGNLSSLEHKILDFCFSFVQKTDTPDKVYKLEISSALKYLGRNASGRNYTQFMVAFRNLHKETSLAIPFERDGQRGIRLTSLFDYIDVLENGTVEFRFSSYVAPMVFELKRNYYSFRLSELSLVKSKYTLSLLKLWNSHTYGVWRDYSNPQSLPPAAKITGTLEEWEGWLLGTDETGKPKRWAAGRFKQNALAKAISELERLYPAVHIDLVTEMAHRRTVGFTVTFQPIHSHLQLD